MGDDDDRLAITCTFNWEPQPHITFWFHPEIDFQNIQQIAIKMAKTAAAKMDDMNLCAIEGELHGQSGNA